MRPNFFRMDVLTEFKIPYIGLKEGQHHYSFKIDRTFFSLLGKQDLEKADVAVEVLLDKKSSMIVADISFEGTVTNPCDRCMESVDVAIEGEEKIIYKMGEGSDEDDESIVEVPSNVGKLDLAPQVYEVVVVNIPLRMVHETEEECDPSVMNKLKSLKPKVNINSQWEELLKLKSE